MSRRTWISPQQQVRDHNGQRNICAECGHEGTKHNPLGINDDGYRVHPPEFENRIGRSPQTSITQGRTQ